MTKREAASEKKVRGITLAFDGLAELHEFGAPSGVRFLVEASHDGPYEVRALVVNGSSLVEPPIETSERLLEIPIPDSIKQPYRILWWITAGHKILKMATGLVSGNQAPVMLRQKGPLAKGESWTTKDPVTFPKE